MREPHDSRAPLAATVLDMRDRLVSWFLECALPVWDAHGVDRSSGGYFETLAASTSAHGYAAAGALRRGRVVARQIYAFDVGQRLGWCSAHTDPVAHGSRFLFTHLHAGGGRFHTDFDLQAGRPVSPFSLYEQAFYLFTLARLRAGAIDPARVELTAGQCFERLCREFGRAQGGFEESNPPSLPLKSNPHMHLLEAALEWCEVDAGTRWVGLARSLVSLCLTRFCDPSTGAIREYFNAEWQPADGALGQVVEPGHQFEWAWLLMRWAQHTESTPAERRDCLTAAERLVRIGETSGVDPQRGVAVNEIWLDGSPKDRSAKLWPQTERLKAWCAMLERAVMPEGAVITAADLMHEGDDIQKGADRAARFDAACEGILKAAQGMSLYFRTDAPGLWHEVCLVDGSFEAGPTKASSLYHVVCAINELCKTSSRSFKNMLYSRELYPSGQGLG